MDRRVGKPRARTFFTLAANPMSRTTIDPPPRAAASPQPLATAIAALAEQCVKCGLCLPHCPTYRVTKVEGESPRGRIAFAQAIATGFEPTPAMRTQLDDCTACGTCETVCPSQVRYDALITATRAAIDAPRDESRLARVVRWLAESRKALALLGMTRRLPWRYAADAIASFAPRYARAARMVPHLAGADRPPTSTRATGDRVGTAILFRGCVASLADADIHRATARVLAAIGYDVLAPRDPHCCGALARHAGDADRARGLASQARAGLDAWLATADDAGPPDTVVVGTATGCHRDVAALVGVTRFADVLTLLANSSRYATLPWRERPVRAAWLAPCTQSPAGTTALLSLARHLPGLTIEALPLQPRCCGAAGTYFVDHAHIADALLAERIGTILAAEPDVVLTTNVGCRLQLQAGLRAAGVTIRVLHPIELFDEALP